MNKRGWIKILEAFIAILLIAGVALFLYGGKSSSGKDFSSEIYPIQRQILSEIQSNGGFRSDIVKVSETNLPISWENFNKQNNLHRLREFIISRTPPGWECVARICKMNSEICDIGYIGEAVYAQPTIISTDLEEYSPKQLKLFCYLG